ncbi:MAG: UbiD family decarboxylase [Alphaproteobacteria bacterium]|nr:UbiD family decarboxylase [Alphaproteobacteria bacterium]
MTHASLRDFIAFLERRGALVRVRAPVSPVLEMTEIGRRLIGEGGPATLFENLVGADAPYAAPWPRKVLANLFGTTQRVAWAMGRELDELRTLGESLAFLQHPDPPASLKEALAMLPKLRLALAKNPRTVSDAPCQQVVLRGGDIDLAKIPIQTCWPGEPAPLITFPLVVTKAPGAKPEDANLGIYRMQVIGRDRTLMRWLQHRGGAQHLAQHGESSSAPLPVAAVIGADPATTIAAVTPIPDKVSEYAFAGLLRGRRTRLADCVSVPLKVPAEAEMVIEGHVSLSESGNEGPYGDHTGYYNAVERFPVFTVSAITMREDAIYHTTFTGRPPDEPSVLAQALGEVFVPMLRRQFPEIVDFYLPPEACSYRIAVVSIRKAYPGHAKRVMMGIWSFLRQFLYTKYIIVVNDDIDVRSWTDVMWAVATKMDPGRDITIVNDTPIDYLDFASPQPGLGGKAGLDATDKIGPETAREWGQPIRMADDIVDLVTQKWADYGLPPAEKPPTSS